MRFEVRHLLILSAGLLSAVSIVLFTAGLGSIVQPVGWTWALLIAVSLAIKAGKYGLVLTLMIFARYFQGKRNKGKRRTAWAVLSMIVVLNFLGVYSSLSQYVGREVAVFGGLYSEVEALEGEVGRLEDQQEKILADIGDDADFAVTATGRKAVALGLTENRERITELNDRLAVIRAEIAERDTESHLAGLFALAGVFGLSYAAIPVLMGLLIAMLLDPLEVYLIYIYGHLTSRIVRARLRLRPQERRRPPRPLRTRPPRTSSRVDATMDEIWGPGLDGR